MVSESSSIATLRNWKQSDTEGLYQKAEEDHEAKILKHLIGYKPRNAKSAGFSTEGT